MSDPEVDVSSQYYARLDATDLLFGKVRDLRGCGYDRKNGLLYSFEAYGAKDLLPIVHVWKLGGVTK